jgi:hypothetical protein
MLCAFILLSGLIAATGCSSALDCSLNGICSGQACACNPGWVGSDCSALNIGAVNVTQGRNGLPFSSSWGGAVLLDNGVYHLFYSRILGNGCTLNQWQTNSACWHAVGTNPLGPFTDVAEVLQSFCHNAVPAIAPDGTYLLYHIGCGGVTPTNCSSDAPAPHSSHYGLEEVPTCVGGGGLYPRLLYATDINGPWSALPNPILNGSSPTSWDASVTNVAPVFLPNGTVLLAYRGKNASKAEKLGVASAPNWKGPYIQSVTGPIIAAPGEDPFPFIDRNGNYHILFHDFSATNGGHAYATEWTGPWYYTGAPAYNLTVTFTNGTTSNLSRRERPQLYFDPTSGNPTVLYTGVVPGPDHASLASFTLAAAITS